MAKKKTIKVVAEVITEEDLFNNAYSIVNEAEGVEEWDFKEYILCPLFYRYISEKLNNYLNEAEGDGFDYSLISDEEAEQVREDMVNTFGYFILPSDLFMNVVNDCDKNENLNTTISNAFKRIEESSSGYDDIPDTFNGLLSGFDIQSKSIGETVKEKNEKISNILKSIASLPFDKFIKYNPNIYGDCFAFLIRKFAGTIKKNQGDYFTPKSLAKLVGKLATLGHNRVQKVYDGSCGSGSLLIEVANNLGIENVRTGFFGQDWDKTFYKLFKMNMIMHNINFDKYDIEQADTLLSPRHNDDTPFDIVVSNPKFSESWVGEDDTTLINDDRYSCAGKLAPKGNADFAFILHGLSYLSESGTLVMVCNPGVLYREKAEQTIRQYLIDNNRVDTIIQLTDKFSKGGISLAILILKKNKKDNSVYFVDATNEFVVNDTLHKLSDENISRIISYYETKEDRINVSRIVSYDEITNDKNKYNLSVSNYVIKEEKKEDINIKEVNAKCKELSSINESLKKTIDSFVEEMEC